MTLRNYLLNRMRRWTEMLENWPQNTVRFYDTTGTYTNPTKKILFCTCHYNEWSTTLYAYSLYRTKWPKNTRIDLMAIMGCGTGKALDVFAKAAVDGGFDLMVFACNDAGWEPGAVLKLISDDKDIVTGWSCERFHPFRVKAFTSIDRENVRMTFREGVGKGVEKVYSPAGELQVYKVDVFKKLQYPFFQGITNKLGEPTTDDFVLGCRCWDAHVDIFVDWDVPLKHISSGMITENGKLRAT